MLVRRIEEMERCHRDVLERVDKVENALRKFRDDDNVDDMKLALDVFLLYMRTTLREHKKSEEDVLLPFLRSVDHPESEVESILSDHEEIHRGTEALHLLKEMDRENQEQIEESIRGLIGTLRSHIELEDELLKATKEKLSASAESD